MGAHCAATALALLASSAAWAQDSATVGSAAAPITLHYNARFPYAYAQDGAVNGLLAQPIERAFRKAGVAFVWAETPSARQFALVKANAGADCLAGRFRTEERTQWARFSKPVYRDQPQGLLMKASNAKRKSLHSLVQAVQSSELALLVKTGYSYGPVLDAAIAQRSTAPLRTSDESADMLRQIQMGMADAFIIAAEEAQALLERARLPAKDFAFLPFRDAPPGELRYVMCSHRVPPGVMERLNAAIGFKER